MKVKSIVGISPTLALIGLFAGTPALTDTVRGTAGFDAGFLARGLRDASGRSLRELDLHTRLFRYPLSYLIHSRAFAAMPSEVVRAVLERVRGELTGEDSRIEALPGSPADRQAAWEIFVATAPQMVAEQTPDN